MVGGLCHAGKEASHERASCEKGVQPTSVRIAGLRVLRGCCEAIGFDCGKTTIESPKENQFCLGINIELNEREVMEQQIQNERMGSRES